MARELQSWKEIAAYLGVTIRTAQNWEAERGLPVRRLPGPRGRVFALEEDLDAWKGQQQEVEPAPHPAEPQPVSSFPPRLRQHARWIIAVTLLVVSAAIAAGVYPTGRTKEPVTFLVRGDSFLASSASGDILWTKTFAAPLLPITPESVSPFSVVLAVDLDGDGHTEVLFNPAFKDIGATELICWEADGRERWRYSLHKSVRSRQGTFDPVYQIRRFVPIQTSGTVGRQLVVIANHHYYYPSHVAVVSANGKEQREYWHPGHLHEIQIVDLDRDGSPEILAAGISNGEGAGTAVLLDPRTMQGTPTVKTTPEKELLDLPPAQEIARILFPRSTWNQEHWKYNDADWIRVLPDGIMVGLAEDFSDVHRPAIDYRFDSKLQLVSIDPSDIFLLLLRKQYRALGNPPDPWSIEKSKLGPVQVIKPGNSSASPRTSSGTSQALD